MKASQGPESSCQGAQQDSRPGGVVPQHHLQQGPRRTASLGKQGSWAPTKEKETIGFYVFFVVKLE